MNQSKIVAVGSPWLTAYAIWNAIGDLAVMVGLAVLFYPGPGAFLFALIALVWIYLAIKAGGAAREVK